MGWRFLLQLSCSKLPVSKYLAFEGADFSDFERIESCFSRLYHEVSSSENFSHVEMTNRASLAPEEVSQFFTVKCFLRASESSRDSIMQKPASPTLNALSVC
jgi:hypothetical protein